MPFGLCNAPAKAAYGTCTQRTTLQTCLVYLDDIIVMGRTFDEHLKNLGEVLERIIMAELKLSVKKCVFLQNGWNIWGFLLQLMAYPRMKINNEQ